MGKRIIHIDEEKCSGCGACVSACHEGAIAMVGGKARLLREDYCDGLGDCLPACPSGAITFVEKEATASRPAGCPGIQSQSLSRREPEPTAEPQTRASRLAQWPVQIKLVPLHAPYFDQADLLIAADCTAYAYADFHERFMRKRVTLIGCPKLDAGDYTEKLTAILRENQIRSLTIVRMEVPCCGGLEQAAKNALQASGKFIPWQVYTLSPDGKISD